MKTIKHTAIIMTLVTSAFLLFTPAIVKGAYSETTNIIPIPVSTEQRSGFFVFKPSIRVVAEKDAQAEALKLIDALAPAMGYRLKLTSKARPKAKAVRLSLDEQLSQLGDEGYVLDVSTENILIRAKQSAGIFYGIQTLLQLLPAPIFCKSLVKGADWKVPCLKITDYPRFQWRGLLIDPARHFIPVKDVKKFLRVMAMHKFNRLQVHLTDNIGWRIEIKKYPNLTELASNRDRSGGKGGFYTQQEIRELVRYAKERHITIVPEIEMPYHAGAAINAYPYIGINPARVEGMSLDKRWAVLGGLAAPRPETVEFMQNVLAEVIELFPSLFIHIGGDEANLKLWENDPEMQKQMKQLGCKNAHELHSWFIKQMDTFLTRKNRRLLGWDEILQGGLAPGATVMSWRGIQGGITAAKAGHDVVMAPTSHTYFDYRQAPEELGLSRNVINLEKVYSFEPLPAELSNEQAKHVLGGQAQLWGELIADQNRREFMTYPRACALIETIWSPKQSKSYKNFFFRLMHHLERLDAMSVNYRQLD
ncbi:MAG: beta-N-acetylhexosaminidase [Planctomycetes bacterium]|nr:beta-N-acetylhexosaminidase [Planctomycetota bacterium]